MTGETKTSSERGEFMDHLLPVLTLLVIGYPLTPATIRGNASRLDSGCCRYHVVHLARLLPYNMVRYDLQEGDSSVSAAVVAGRSFQTGK